MNDVQKSTGIFLLTINQLEGYEIVEYYGLVSGHAIVGANFIKDFFARVTDVVGAEPVAMSGLWATLQRGHSQPWPKTQRRWGPTRSSA